MFVCSCVFLVFLINMYLVFLDFNWMFFELIFNVNILLLWFIVFLFVIYVFWVEVNMYMIEI